MEEYNVIVYRNCYNVCRKWIKGKDGTIGFGQEDRCKICKEHYGEDYE